MANELTAEEVLALLLPLLEYQPLTGLFIWRRSNKFAKHVKAGMVAGHVHKDGYTRINVVGRQRKAHRLAWLFTYGEWPIGQVDHKNGAKSDNRISNLRDTDNRGNGSNKQHHRDGKPVGVGFQKNTGMWRARIKIDGKERFLGDFTDMSAAALAYQLALKDLEYGHTEMENSND